MSHPDFSGFPGSMWIEPDTVNNSALLFLTLIYAMILYQSSDLISSGSELLLLVPSLAGLVGSIVLPILGAVPDGMMTLFSGLGPDAQSEVGIGMGVLAGSTVMLLTFPWFIAVVAGRVPIKDGEANYKDKKAAGGLFDSGVCPNEELSRNAWMMLGTTLIYLVIQIPASIAESKDSDPKADQSIQREATAESLPALIGLVLSVFGFFGYLYACYSQSQKDDKLDPKVLTAVIDGIKRGEVSISAALQFTAGNEESDLKEPLTEESNKALQKRVTPIVKPFFQKYDTDKSNSLEISEFKILLGDLGQVVDETAVKKAFKEYDTDNSGSLNLEEVVKGMIHVLSDTESLDRVRKKVEEDKLKGAKTIPSYGKKAEDDQGEDDEEEEEEEMPEDLRDLTPEEQQARIKRRAVWMMALGTIIVVLVSDPFVDVLNVWGKRFDIPAFYVSFVVAPFASNASELLSAYNYAAKKTKGSITVALSTLIGAACMNNTFVLAVFFCLVHFKKLAWQFTAETLAIMIVQWIIGCMAIFKKTHSLFFGFVILSCYPLCLAIVAGLEAHGFD